MKYKYSSKCSYEDLSAGRVIYSAKGIPNFPVRLAHEIFNRCLQYCRKKENIVLYDPCCGGGYLLTTIAMTNPKKIAHLIGSDIDLRSLEIAEKNLKLLTKEGMNSRRSQLQDLYCLYSKESHLNAINSAVSLEKLLSGNSDEITSEIFRCDITDMTSPVYPVIDPDIIITDVPYGSLVSWSSGENSISSMLTNLHRLKTGQQITAVVHNRQQKAHHDRFRRLEKFRSGERCVDILEAV